MGSFKPWPDAMEALTGQREMSALSLLNYFKPLQEWLEKENARNGEFIGWKVPIKKSSNNSASKSNMALGISFLTILSFITAVQLTYF